MVWDIVSRWPTDSEWGRKDELREVRSLRTHGSPSAKPVTRPQGPLDRVLRPSEDSEASAKRNRWDRSGWTPVATKVTER